MRICSTKPERKCNLSDEEKIKFEQTECNVYYETVCQTTYTQKIVIEDRPICENIVQEMCDDQGKNCMQFMKKVCTTQQVPTLKAIPSTSCDQKAQEICVTPECPLVS